MLRRFVIFISLFSIISFASIYDIALLKEQANNGDMSALYQLGFIYENGKGVEIDIKQAMSYYQKAADQGHSDSLFALELLEEINHLNDNNTARQGLSNSVEVKETTILKYQNSGYIELLKKYAKMGDANAEYKLGIMYDNGYGVDRDYIEAINWYRKAANKGHKDALLAVELLSELSN